MNKNILSAAVLLFSTTIYSQVGMGTQTPNISSALDVVSDSKGILIPRVSLNNSTDNTTITSGNINSLLIFNTASNNDVNPGYYYWLDSKWVRLTDSNDINSLFNASNGIDFNSITKKVELGGTLNRPTELVTSSSNTLSVKNLSKGSTTDDIIVSDPSTGVLKKVKAVMPKFFYAPSVYIPTHDANGNVLTGQRNIQLYNDVYAVQFGVSSGSTFASSNSAVSLPILPSNELDYFVTYWDTSVFTNVSINSSGQLSYSLVDNPNVTSKTYMNIVFRVKD